MPRFPRELLNDMKQRRLAIPPSAPTIGGYTRLPTRIGRSVTQEELAEALQISREWYCALENGRCSDASPELMHRIALSLYDAGVDRKVQWEMEATEVANLSEVRRYISRIAGASSFLDAAVDALETGSRLVDADCVSIVTLDDESAGQSYVAGPAARHWKPLCDEVVREAHRAMRRDGVGVSEEVPTVEDVAADPAVFLAFHSVPHDDGDYAYECSIDRWRDFNGDLGVRSVLALPLNDRSGRLGTIGFSWSQPRRIGCRTIELARTLVSALELLA